MGSSPPSRLPQDFVARKQVATERLLEPARGHLVVGPRQAGKSTLAWSVLRQLTRPLFLNLEEPILRAWCASPAQFMADLTELGPMPEALFLEEAQWLPRAALFVKGVVDLRPPFPILVTGSASFQLRDRVRETLAGRATRHLLLPFALSEVAPIDQGVGPAVNEMRRREALQRLLRVGGYPEVWLSQSPERVLGDLLQAFVLRDASDLFAVERLDAYQKLLQLAAHQIGNLSSISELAAPTGVTANTAARYLSLMEEAHIVKLVPPFAGGKRREVTTARKVFFIDNGLRNAVLGRAGEDPDQAADKGALVENWVFSELVKALPWTQPVRYWRSLSGAEVDFVVDFPSSLLGIEVKATMLTRPRLSRSSRSFITAYHPTEFWVVNDGYLATEQLGSTEVVWLSFHELPERLQRWQDAWP